MKKQVHAYYRGRVQGVGFRFTAQRLADDLGIGGWVKNLEDGRVEIVAEAEEDTLKGFLSEIQRVFSRYVMDAEINWEEPKKDFKEFRVAF